MKKIAFIGQPEYFRAFYENDLNNIYEVKEFSLNFNMNENDFCELIDFNAHYNIFFRGEFIPNSVLQKLNGITIALSSEPFPSYIDGKLNFTYDSYKRFETFLAIKNKQYDYVFHYDASSVEFLKNHGIYLNGVFEFPIATGTYRPMEMEKKWDVFFIGRSTDYREKFLGSLKHYFNVLHIAHGIHGNDLVPYMNQSKILLNLHAENEISWEPRVQMLMATGGLVISQKLSPNDLLIPGVDYIEVDMTDHYDLCNKVKYYLEHDEECASIAKNGYLKVQKYFDAKTKFTQLINDIEASKYEKFKIVKSKKFHKHLKYFSFFISKMKGKK
jgi:spore maturation protein CgeB